jgi:anti-sigma B factor antagonist
MTVRIPGMEHALVYFTGELDASSAGRIDEVIARARSTSPASITADLSQVTFLGSAALSAFLQAWRDCAAVGTELRMRGPQRTVRRILDLTATARMFGV